MQSWATTLLLFGEVCFLAVTFSEMVFCGELEMLNGKKAKIWKDKWIHRPMSNSIQSPINLLADDAFVAELIDNDAHY